MKRNEICEKVTNRIIEQLEKGIIPWEKPWIGGNGAWKRSSGEPYSFLNQLILPPGEYASFRQIQAEGGRVNKGEKGHTIVFWKRIVKEYEEDGEIKVKSFPYLKYWTVFNIEKQTNLEVKHEPPKVKGAGRIETLEQIKDEYISWSGINFEKRESGHAYYQKSTDTVVVPLKKQFRETEGYYDTVFHELAHSTGHEKRLGRKLAGRSTDIEAYSLEELIAELTSASILANYGFETDNSFRNNVAYIQSWIKALKNDSEMIVSAGGKAGKAFEMITGAGEALREGLKQPHTDTKTDMERGIPFVA